MTEGTRRPIALRFADLTFLPSESTLKRVMASL